MCLLAWASRKSVFAPHVCSDKTWTVLPRHAVRCLQSWIRSHAHEPPHPPTHLFFSFLSATVSSPLIFTLGEVSDIFRCLSFPLDLLQRASYRGCCGSVWSLALLTRAPKAKLRGAKTRRLPASGFWCLNRALATLKGAVLLQAIEKANQSITSASTASQRHRSVRRYEVWH